MNVDLPIRALISIAAALTLITVAAGGIWIAKSQFQPVASTSRHCGVQPYERPSLFSDDSVTQIRLSAPDLSDLRVLREEPADDLPGMFDSLLSLTDDGSRLAYVTARNALMDDAHIWWIDVRRPVLRSEVVKVGSGLWPIRPSWSPDRTRLAYVTVEDTGAAARFRLWAVGVGGSAGTPAVIGDVAAQDFTNGRQSAICWDRDGRPLVVDTAPGLTPATPATAGPSQDPGAATPGASPVPGSSCGVPVFSQNDPTWRHLVMAQAGDAMGGFGCAVTSTAMMFNYYGSALTPAALSACLGPLADPLHWSKAPDCTKGMVSGGEMVAFSWSRLDAILQSGQPAIVGVLRGQTGTHFVVVTEGGGGASQYYTIADPWDGSTTKTLASYSDTGYNPSWIITYSGPGRNCNRAKINAGGYSLSGGSDGGAYKDGVKPQVDGGPGAGKAAGISVVNVTPTKPEMLSPSPSPKASPVDKFPKPKQVKLPYSFEILNEGIYQVVVQPWPPKYGNPVVKFKLTVDKTPPVVDVGLTSTVLNPSVARVLPNAADKPRVKKPARLRITSKDGLSGVALVEYQLDGGAWKVNSDEISFKRLVAVDTLGDHVLSARATDLAGNMSAVKSFEFTVWDDAAVPTPTPTPSTPANRATATPPPPTAAPTPVPPAWAIRPASHDFHWQSGLFEFTVVNVGGSTGTLSAITVSTNSLPPGAASPYTDYGKGTCRLGVQIPVNATCTVMVQYTYSRNPMSPTGLLTVTGSGKSASATLASTPSP
jgi:hypothetical protein